MTSLLACYKSPRFVSLSRHWLSLPFVRYDQSHCRHLARGRCGIASGFRPDLSVRRSGLNSNCLGVHRSLSVSPQPSAAIRAAFSFSMKPITLAQARRVLEVVDAGLCSGLGQPKPGQMCVEAAVCYALGQPHGDEPECVSPAVRGFKITLNDASWSSNKARALGMRRVAVAQLGSRGVIDEKLFAKIVAEQTIRQILPRVLRIVAKLPACMGQSVALEAAAVQCEKDGDKKAAYAAAAAAAAYAAAAAAAAYAAYAAAAAAAARAARAAADAAYAAADAARAAIKERDSILSMAAEIGVLALRECKSPGVVLMDKLGI